MSWNYGVYTASGSRDTAASTDWVFVYDITKPIPVQKQVIQVPNTYNGIVFDPNGVTFYVSGGRNDNMHIYSADDPSLKSPADLLGNIVAQSSEDDISLIWLKDQSQTAAAVTTLEDNQGLIGSGEIFSGPSLELLFNNPAVDPRTSDIVVQSNVGVIYTGGKKKIAEHGGFAHDDLNVVLLVSNARLSPATITIAGHPESSRHQPFRVTSRNTGKDTSAARCFFQGSVISNIASFGITHRRTVTIYSPLNVTKC